jgi:predicted acylesterase/phospholipase RssA
LSFPGQDLSAEEKIAESLLRSGKVNILINPQIGQIKFTEFNRADECIRAGELATLSNLALIKEIYRRKKLN